MEGRAVATSDDNATTQPCDYYLDGIDKPLDRLNDDRETKREQKDTVHQSTENFCTLPAVREIRGPSLALGELFIEWWFKW